MTSTDRSFREYWGDPEIQSLGPFLWLGIAGLVGAFFLPEHSLLREVVRDMAIALVVSVLVGGLIEIRRHERTRRAAELGMLELLGEHLVPKAVLAQFTQNILPSGIVCEPWHLLMRLAPIVSEHESGATSAGCHITCHSTLKYRLRNYLSHEQTINLQHELGNPEAMPGQDEMRARFDRIQWSIYPIDGRPTTRVLRGTEISTYLLSGDQGELAIPCALPADGSIEVELERTELLPCPGQFPWYMFWSTLNPTVKIETSGLEDVTFALLLRHPKGRHVEPVRPNEWEIRAALLQGQGFALTASVSAEPPLAISAEGNPGQGRMDSPFPPGLPEAPHPDTTES